MTTAELKFEHFAVNVAEPEAVADWYVQHLGMRVERLERNAARMHFLCDATGRVVLEIYCNPPDAVPDYSAMHPLQLHLAFATADVDASRARLLAAGAQAEGEVTVSPRGDRLAMLRDPWGFCIQLCQRVEPMV